MWSGSIDDIDNARPKDYIATMEFVKAENPLFSASLNPEMDFKFTHVAEHVAETKKALAKSKLIHSRGRRGYSASLNREMATLENSAALNDSAIDQTTIVQFVHQIIGKLQNVNVVAKAFTSIPSNRLRGKIPEGAWPDVSVQVDRLSEPQITHSDFGQNEFRIKRNDVHIYISREDRMEAAIDPFSYSTLQGQKQLLQTRDLLALKALSNLEINSTYGTFSDVTAGTTNVVPRANVDSANQFLELITGHFVKYRNNIKYIIMHPQDYRAHQTNYFIRNNIKQEVAKNYGIVPFTGLEEYGIMAILSPWVPRLTLYALSDEGAYELDGPKIVDSDYDVKKFADYTPMRDFVGYIISNPKRFGEKISFPISGVTSGTEITKDSQIEDLLKAPDVIKNENANSGI